ncbi:uncharacterized protein LOC123320884 [Coccinella septempunctata]|uniref:uncharacterized protein LOC123320884 n=1 Tax=Coccinella septempunctata TaxID=41139 RepID=UPI001D062738|nr:uncharacterized protein LOC123320884 [Coccinella septempunctata]
MCAQRTEEQEKEMRIFLQRHFGNLPDRAPWWFNFAVVFSFGFLCSALYSPLEEIGGKAVDTYHYIRGNMQPEASVNIKIKKIQSRILPMICLVFTVTLIFVYGICKLKTALRKYIFYCRGRLSLSDYISFT